MVRAVEFRYGPDGIPFHLLGGETVVDGSGRVPFHGIISRGLLYRVRHAIVPFCRWEEHGHLLHYEAEAESSELARWRRTASECGVLSFAQSASCVRSYIEQHAGTDAYCEIWIIKEGHTSSVWRVQIEDRTTRQEFAVNVARDQAAGEELRRSSNTMRLVGESWPEANLAKVLDIAKVRLPRVADPVVVTRNEWIPNSREIHRLPASDNEPGPLIAVERFLTEDSAPSRIRRILGRRLTEVECEQVNRDVREFLEKTSRLAVRVDINEGDLVWNGQHAIVIAIR